MKFFLIGLTAVLSAGLTGCLETGYSYHMCNSENRHWVENLSEGHYGLMAADQSRQEYFVTKGPSDGIYFFTFFKEGSGSDFSAAYIAQSCTIEGQLYLENSYGGAAALGLIKISPSNENNWKLEILEPNLETLAQFGLPVQDRPGAEATEPKKYIYNSDQAVPYGHWKLAPFMFDVSSKEENQNLSLKKMIKN